MSEYRVFAGEHYYPSGGYDDYIGKVETVAEATEMLASLATGFLANRSRFDWAQLVLDDEVVAYWANGKWRTDKGDRYVGPEEETDKFFITVDSIGRWSCRPYGGGVSDDPRPVIVYFNDESLGGILTQMDNSELTTFFNPTTILTRLAYGEATDTDHEILKRLKKADNARAFTD